MKVAVLLSLGRHPASGRTRRAPEDARALQLALGLPGAEVTGLHAGPAADPALLDYLGQGLPELGHLEVREGHDPLPALQAHLQLLAPDLVLAGGTAEAGEASGMLPYLLAEALGLAVVPGIVALSLQGSVMELLQALPGGRRAVLRAPVPLLATASPAAPAPRPVAYAAARRGRLRTLPVSSAPDLALAAMAVQPARPRGTARPTAGSAAERLRMATEAKAGQGRVLIDPDPDTAARAILDHLAALGFTPVAAPADGERS